jgi:hopanoid biosynthesis associated radical SAM protein HpnH
MYPDIDRLVAELVKRKKYVYLCTNAILLKEKLDLFTPSKYLSVQRAHGRVAEEHDEAVCRDGVYDEAVPAIQEALARGFRVTTNTTLFDGASPLRVREFFDEMMRLGVEGMMVSPATATRRRPTRSTSSGVSRTNQLFSEILSKPKRHWRFNQSPLFLRFLMGKQDYECTPVGQPDLQHVRLAAAVLPPPGRLCGDLQGADGDHALGELRAQEREREVPRTAWSTAGLSPPR